MPPEQAKNFIIPVDRSGFLADNKTDKVGGWFGKLFPGPPARLKMYQYCAKELFYGYW